MKDFCLDEGSVFFSDERDLIVQQIDMLFDTMHGEVCGEWQYGSDFHQFLWDLKASNQDISEYTQRIIERHVNLFNWTCSVETDILAGTKNDIILITVSLKSDYDTIKKTYRVE